MPELLVVNASPLIFLGNADRLDLLRVIGERVMVPQTVFDEVAGSTHADKAASAVARTPWLERQPLVTIPNTVVEWDLGPGESAVIAVAQTFAGSTVVIDDLSGRKCALAHRLNLMGTLGIVIAAHRCGHIQSAHQVLLELRAAGMWLSDSVIERALRLAEV